MEDYFLIRKIHSAGFDGGTLGGSWLDSVGGEDWVAKLEYWPDEDEDEMTAEDLGLVEGLVDNGE